MVLQWNLWTLCTSLCTHTQVSPLKRSPFSLNPGNNDFFGWTACNKKRGNESTSIGFLFIHIQIFCRCHFLAAEIKNELGYFENFTKWHWIINSSQIVCPIYQQCTSPVDSSFTCKRKFVAFRTSMYKKGNL